MPNAIQAETRAVPLRCGRCDAEVGFAPALGEVEDGELYVPCRSRRGRGLEEPAANVGVRGALGNGRRRPAPRRGPRSVARPCPRCQTEPSFTRHDLAHAERVARERGWPEMMVVGREGMWRLVGPHGERLPHRRPV